MTDLFSPVQLGRYTLANRIVMAPMTRSRALPDGTPGALAALYYAQRADLGLVIAEGAQPSAAGQGYMMTPGIYTPAHIAGWRAVSNAVKTRGARFFIQIMHVGRISHPDNLPAPRQGLAPSALVPEGAEIFTPSGLQPISCPREMSAADISQTIRDFQHAARCAIDAGADGIEIHGANGYLIQQFLAANANQRLDAYGGSITNRCRFAVEVAAGVADAIGADRIGIRLSPGTNFGGINEGDDQHAIYDHLTTELDKLGLAYLHLMHFGDAALLSTIRKNWTGTLILNRPNRARDAVGADVTSGLADLESFGQWILANPDFAHRLKTGADFAVGDRMTFFGGGPEGYTDYPRADGTQQS